MVISSGISKVIIFLSIFSIALINVTLYWSNFDNFLDGEAINYAMPHPVNSVFRHAWNPKWPYCRAFGMLLWRIEYIFFERNCSYYHIENTIVHIISNILILFIAAKLFNNMKIGFLAGFIWATHPMHAENIYILASKFDPQVTILMTTLLLIWMYYSTAGGKTKYMISMVLVAITMFTKEFGVMLPILMFLYHFMVNYEKNEFAKKLKGSIIKTLPAFLILILFLSYHVGRFTASTPTPTSGYIANIFLEYKETIRNFITYMRMLHTNIFVMIIMLLGCLKPRREFFYALTLMILPIIVILQMGPQVRFMYTASIGFSMAIAYSIYSFAESISAFFKEKRHYSILALKVILVFFMAFLLFTQVNEARFQNDVHHRYNPERHYMKALKELFPEVRNNTIIYCTNIPDNFMTGAFSFYAEYQYFDINLYTRSLIHFFYTPSLENVDDKFDGLYGFDNRKRIGSFKKAKEEELIENAIFINFPSPDIFNYELVSFQKYKPQFIALKKKYNMKEYPMKIMNYTQTSPEYPLSSWIAPEITFNSRPTSIVMKKPVKLSLSKSDLDLVSLTVDRISIKCRTSPLIPESSANIVLSWKSIDGSHSGSLTQKIQPGDDFKFYQFNLSDNLDWILSDVIGSITIEFKGNIDWIEVESITLQSPDSPNFLQPIPGLPVDT